VGDGAENTGKPDDAEGSTMAADYDHVRVLKSTKVQFERIKKRFERAAAAGQRTIERDTRGRFSDDKVVLLMIREFDLKDARNARARERRRLRRYANGETAPDQLPPVAGND
jgi:hypothetical protein